MQLDVPIKYGLTLVDGLDWRRRTGPYILINVDVYVAVGSGWGFQEYTGSWKYSSLILLWQVLVTLCLYLQFELGEDPGTK